MKLYPPIEMREKGVTKAINKFFSIIIADTKVEIFMEAAYMVYDMYDRKEIMIGWVTKPFYEY